jgi:glucose-1-phosphate thymidylyltransferase
VCRIEQNNLGDFKEYPIPDGLIRFLAVGSGGVMRGLILSGGKGTRLSPLTATLPKQLVPVANRPVLLRIADQLDAAGIDRLTVVVGDRADRVRDALAMDGRGSVAFVEQLEPLGIGDAVLRSACALGGESFCLVLGDLAFEHDLGAEAVRFLASGEVARVVVVPVDDASRYGVAETASDGSVTRLMEKPTGYGSGLALTGIYFFTPAIHDVLASTVPSARGELEITDAIDRLVRDGARVGASVIDGFWVDTGTLDGALEANRQAMAGIATEIRGSVDAATTLDGPVVVGSGTSIRSSVLRGPAVIGAGCRLDGVVVGPGTAIGDGSCLRDCSVSNVALLGGVEVVGPDVVVEQAIVGAGSRIRQSVTRAILGERYGAVHV